MKTLIVEDDRASAILLRRLLEQWGHLAVIVENAAEAWARLRAEEFDLLLCAAAMPGLDGLDLIRRIRSRVLTTPHIVLLTGRDRRVDHAAGMDAGVDDFLSMPVQQDELFARVCVAERMLLLKARLDAVTTEFDHAVTELARSTEINNSYTTELRATCRDLEKAHVKLKAAAITDGLTGLKNHREFQERLEDEMSRASRYHHPLSLAMVDVDHFKRFNDTYGHPAGDDVLRRVARLLEAHARETDVIARYGGEEFAVILANTDHDQAVAAAERFRRAIEAEPWPHCPITISTGVATLRILPQSRADFTTEADMALYACKSQGRNCVMHFAEVRETT